MSINKAKVMTQAWTISKAAAAKFGGKSSEFFAQSLKWVWEIIKTQKETAIRYGLIIAEVKKLSLGEMIVAVAGKIALRGGFEGNFAADNAERFMKFGDKCQFSEKQATVITNLYNKYF